jgi:hypothetical protein
MNQNNKQEPILIIAKGIAKSILFHLIRTIYIIFVVSRACVYKSYYYFVPPLVITPPKPPPKYEEIYNKYIKFYETPSQDANMNIDINLYDYEKRKDIFMEEKNECEEHWKRKLMYEFTPRGNVIVYYNPYKHAFMYYCDENSVPYQIMQHIAKKYVVMFRCRDFFIDPEMYPDNRILEVMKKEEEALNVKSKKVNDITKCLDKDMNMNNKNIFASLKSYKQDEVKVKGKVATIQPVKNKFSNTFIRLGKTCEFNIIQKPVDKNIAIVNSILFGENNIGKSMDFYDDLEITESPFLKENPSSSENTLTSENPSSSENTFLTTENPNSSADNEDIKFVISELVDKEPQVIRDPPKSWKEFKKMKLG